MPLEFGLENISTSGLQSSLILKRKGCVQIIKFDLADKYFESLSFTYPITQTVSPWEIICSSNLKYPNLNGLCKNYIFYQMRCKCLSFIKLSTRLKSGFETNLIPFGIARILPEPSSTLNGVLLVSQTIFLFLFASLKTLVP